VVAEQGGRSRLYASIHAKHGADRAEGYFRLSRKSWDGIRSPQGVVMLFDGACGFPIAIVDAREITAVRTAAASAVATRLLARKDASDLVLLGSGVQARKHLEAMRAVRPISRVRVWNPFPGLARKFAESEQVNQGIAIEALEGKRADVTGADIICTVTSSTEPVLFGSDIPEGVHINAVGSSFPHARELDSEVIIRANLFVDLRESTLNEAGDVCSVSTKRRFDR
jgi:ornithine cyclodeaminase/alanine dehydrogenase-like protein (mu-crystallin family)